MAEIHPTAVVDPNAELAGDVFVGPFCVVGPKAVIGSGTVLKSHVVVENRTHIGKNNTFFPFASVGAIPQDLKFRGEDSRLVIGDNNTFRESVTLNIGTEHADMETRIGSDCLFMAYTHVAHDCVVGNRVIVGNSTALAGHVKIEDFAILSGLAAVHQFARVGRYAYVGGGTMAVQDVLPFCIAQGDRAELVTVNVVGLKRAGFDRDTRHAVRTAFKRLFFSGETRKDALDTVEREMARESALVAEMCTFIRESNRGVAPARRTENDDDGDSNEDS